MINHVRTLVLNMSDGPDIQVAPFAEYIDPQFIPVPPDVALLTARLTLFGPDPDDAQLNCRVRQLLTLAHLADMAHELTAIDPRITYLPWDQPHDVLATFGVSFSGTLPLIDVTTVPVELPASRLVSAAQLTLLDSTTLQVQSLDDTWTRQVAIGSGGWCEPLQGLRVAVGVQAVPGNSSTLRWCRRPDNIVPAINRLGSAPGILNALDGSSSWKAVARYGHGTPAPLAERACAIALLLAEHAANLGAYLPTSVI